MVSGEDSSRQIIETMLACSAQVSLPAPLALVVAVADDSYATALGADNAFRPSELTNDFIALCFVEQVRQLDQVRHGSRSLPEREQPTDQLLDQHEHAEMRPRAGGSRPSGGFSSPRNPTRANSGTIWRKGMMRQTRRRYTSEFKTAAVARLDEPGETLS